MASRHYYNRISIIVMAVVLVTGLLPVAGLSSHASTMNPTVSSNDALLVANHKLLVADKLDFTPQSITPVTENGNLLFYVIILQPTGYIVVPACRYLPAIMAYSWTSEFGSFAGDNPLFSMLVTDIGQRIAGTTQVPESLLAAQSAIWDEFLMEQPSRSYQQWPPAGSSPTDGWVVTLWTQSSPYNDMCPMIDSQRSAAGCPATAMAQIVNYFETTNGLHFTDADDYYHNYGGANFWIDNDFLTYLFPSWPQLNTYLSTVETHWANNDSLTNQDKAALTVACGFAMKQVYNPGGSGTFNVTQAYNGYQRFGYNSSVLYHGESPEMWNHLAHDMIRAIPAHIAVVNEDWTVGHNMVVDGYNTDDEYHINFGWGGSYNGWYHIPNELPYELTVVEGVVVDIIPAPNLPPGAPGQIYGPSAGQICQSTTFWVPSVVDPDYDPITYLWDWGDGMSSYAGNCTSHAWSAQGVYTIKVKAIDALGAESNWSAPFVINITAPRPVLDISLQAKGAGVSGAVVNRGAASATDIVWTLNVTGGLFKLIHVTKGGTITSIPAGQDFPITSGTFMGLGKINVEISASCAEGASTSINASGSVFLIWVRLA
jgi:hypothetical protein